MQDTMSAPQSSRHYIPEFPQSAARFLIAHSPPKAAEQAGTWSDCAGKSNSQPEVNML